ncbi:glutamine transport system permease protein GlnP [Lentilactobacillus kosonis]|uniref:Glutamine transport system permease protein GlnP n=1 Tax=Lentilactobacillus kosonis TaxID=2810561 RepID=A0A401FNK8_9LACO|nr:glutamine transport system permease protein GlnP [Lentilactobacillus kosonis]
MKHKFIKFFSLLALIAAIGVFFSRPATNVHAEKTYAIGTDVTYPPFEFANKQNKYVGIDIDIMKAIAKREGFKVNIKPVGFDSAVQSLDAGQIDGVIAGMTMTPERVAKFDFGTPYYKTGVIMAVQKNSNIKKSSSVKRQASRFENRYRSCSICAKHPKKIWIQNGYF